MLAAIQAPIIMMSQNRQAARDRLEAEVDHEVNVRGRWPSATSTNASTTLNASSLEFSGILERQLPAPGASQE